MTSHPTTDDPRWELLRDPFVSRTGWRVLGTHYPPAFHRGPDYWLVRYENGELQTLTTGLPHAALVSLRRTMERVLKDEGVKGQATLEGTHPEKQDDKYEAYLL